MRTIRNLALKGGGVKGIAYVGALYELDKKGHFETIERVSGTSAGAIMALMIALQLKPKQIHDLMQGLDFNAFKRGCNPFRIFTKYGLYSGDEILNFVYTCFKKSHMFKDTDEETIAKMTFEEFEAKGAKVLIVFASNLNTQSIMEFSNFKTPGCIVAEAVRASMSIPLFFKSWKFTNNNPNDHIYVDGGVVFNYPLSFFDRQRFHDNPKEINMESLGLFLESKEIFEYEELRNNPSGNNPVDEPMKVGVDDSGVTSQKWYKVLAIKKFKYFMSIVKYMKHLFHTLMSSQNIGFFEDSHLVLRTIFINDLDIPATKFNLKDSEKDDLVESGRSGAKHYFSYIESLNEAYNNTST